LIAQKIPAGFSHATVMVAGQGINATMSAWGDALLSMSGKRRSDPYDDFTLATLGYWTDGGSFYYHNKGDYPSEEAALLAVKADYKARSIPVRYFQWDDWWTTTPAGANCLCSLSFRVQSQTSICPDRLGTETSKAQATRTVLQATCPASATGYLILRSFRQA
jgi:hypothetical protein